MGPHKFFVQATDKKTKQTFVQEIEPKLFSWLQELPAMDAVLNAPNLLRLERYEEQGLFQPTGETQAFYAGVAIVNDSNRTMVPQYHYFYLLRPVLFKPQKKQPYLLKDYARILNQKTKEDDSR